MAAPTRTSGLKGTLFGAALVALPLLAAPALIRGLAAKEWVSYYASLESLPRPRKAAARRLAVKAEEAMRNLAPLPQASEAAIRALEIGQRTEHQDEDRVAALVIYEGIQEASARARSRMFSGAGFAVIEARAATLRDAARRAPAAAAPSSTER